MILTLLIVTSIIGGILFYKIEKYYTSLPKFLLIPFIIGTLITFFLYGILFTNNHILDIKHPVYSSDTGISTLTILISILGGLTISIPFSLTELIKQKRKWK